jgi:hypothetical protein
MNRPFFAALFFAVAAGALGAQQASQSSPYQGVSTPPPDDSIVTSSTPEPKPPAGHPVEPPAPVKAQSASAAVPPANLAPVSHAGPSAQWGDGTDDGIVQVAQRSADSSAPALAERAHGGDPDGDIVHPAPLAPGDLGEGTIIRVELLSDLSSSLNEKGDEFRSRVANDVMQNGQVIIPVGAEIDGRVVDVSTGHFAGHGSMMLRPETVIMPDGARLKLHAAVIGTPGSKDHVGAEGIVTPDRRVKSGSIEYGSAVGAGAAAGAYLGGPAGALAGGLIGAGLVTVHLLVSHPQANLDEGSYLDLTLTERMHLDSPAMARN